MAEGVNVRISGKLKEYISLQVGPDGLYENASEYVRDLIRKDYLRQEELKMDLLYKRLMPGMQADEKEFLEFDPEKVIETAKKQKAENET